MMVADRWGSLRGGRDDLIDAEAAAEATRLFLCTDLDQSDSELAASHELPPLKRDHVK